MNSGGAMTSYRVRVRYADASIGPRLKRRKPSTAGPAMSQNQRVWLSRLRRRRVGAGRACFAASGAEDGDEAVGRPRGASAGFANVELLVEHSVDIRLDHLQRDLDVVRRARHLLRVFQLLVRGHDVLRVRKPVLPREHLVDDALAHGQVAVLEVDADGFLRREELDELPRLLTHLAVLGDAKAVDGELAAAARDGAARED